MAIFVSLFFIFFYLIIFPLPLYGSGYVFSRSFFTGWVVVMFFWAFLALLIITIVPLYEGYKPLTEVLKLIMNKERSVTSRPEMKRSITPEKNDQKLKKGSVQVVETQL